MGSLLAQAADPTLAAADLALEEEEARQEARPYLGMSAIGNQCERQLWYGFRWAQKVRFSAFTLKLFADGHRTEDLLAERLRKVPGVTLNTHDPATGGQIGYRDLNGHFRGHIDGEMIGIIQAPKTWHIWEAKATNDRSFNALKRMVQKLGEKNALREWRPVYYAQSQLYMRYSGYTRHYTTVATPGGRDWTSVRTNYNEVEAQRQIAKAKRVIDAKEPPQRISTAPTSKACQYCDHKNLCHAGVLSDVNCRTCLHSSPAADGQWKCERWSDIIPLEHQRKGCAAHKFIPGLVPGEVISADAVSVTYRLSNGETWRNGEDVSDTHGAA